MREIAGALAVMVALTGCGGGSSSAPSSIPTPPPAFRAIDGGTGEPLTPGSVTPSHPRLGQSVTVIRDGYLPREQPWNGAPVALWPSRDETETEVIRQLVYGDESGTLTRWASSSLDASLQIVGDAWSDRIPEIEEAMEQAFAEVAAAGGPSISLVQSSSGGLEALGGAEFSVIVDRWNECIDDNFIACVRWWRDGPTISRAEIIFDSPEMVSNRKVRTHLLGLVLGLNQAHLHRGAMNPKWKPRGDFFHELEQTALRMMYEHRNPGNALPDRDPAFAPATTGARMETWAHPRPGR